VRNNGTFSSRIFNQQSEDMEERPSPKNRQEQKWKSTVFDGPVQETVSRKKLGGESSGTETLFGQDKIDYENKSNHMSILGTKKAAVNKKWKPVR
jgi:hypothetical protein